MTPDNLTQLKAQTVAAVVEYAKSSRGVLDIFGKVNQYMAE